MDFIKIILILLEILKIGQKFTIIADDFLVVFIFLVVVLYYLRLGTCVMVYLPDVFTHSINIQDIGEPGTLNIISSGEVGSCFLTLSVALHCEVWIPIDLFDIHSCLARVSSYGKLVLNFLLWL